MEQTTDVAVNQQLGNTHRANSEFNLRDSGGAIACLDPEYDPRETGSVLTPADFGRVPSFRSVDFDAVSAVTPATEVPPRQKNVNAYTSAVGLALIAGLTVAMAANTPGLRNKLRARAATEVTEGFREDSRRWAGKEGLSKSWSFNGDGFAIPGDLAIDIQSVPLGDYRMEFNGQIEQKGLSFVYRAMDFDNYYAARIVITNDGSGTAAVLERYAVIDGQAGPKTETRLPFAMRLGTMYRVDVEAAGGHFFTRIDDQLVDAFSDSRLPTGGVGFFSAPGESAQIYRLRLSAHEDLIGKVCSFLLPLS